MTCECVITVEKKLRDKTGDPQASLNMVFAMPSFQALPTLTLNYHPKKRDGSFASRETKEKIPCTFCPFCGERLIPEEK